MCRFTLLHSITLGHLQKNDIKQIAITNNITSVENWENILNSWMESEEEEVILITGSLYFISEVRKTLLNS